MKKIFQNIAKKKALVIIVCLLCAISVICPIAVGAAEYLSENDPLITLSYLKDIFAPQIKEEIKTELAASDAAETPETTPAYTGYDVVELSLGQKLTSQNGTVELIVRPGSSAQVISDIADNGLSDISEMREVLDGENVGINHALIIPRNDGRGIVVTSEKAFVLVRGDYVIS